jgi:uncharacterized protein with ParB-like and HNH nuclease domain
MGNNQISQFLSDLDSCLSSDDPRHFYGLIVYVLNNDNSKKLDLIDGQQRITTLIILFSIIRDLLEDFLQNTNWTEEEKEQINQSVYEINSVLLNPSKSPKLRTENENNFENIFIETIQRKILSYTDITNSPRKEYEEQKIPNKNRFLVKKNYLFTYGDGRKTRAKNSYKNYIAIHDYLQKKLNYKTSNSEKVSFLIELYKTVLDNFRVIPFHVPSYERAFEYFEVLNDRGLDVSALDLVKNKCLKIKGINATQRTTIFNAWSEVFPKKLDHTFNLLQFIRYAYMSKKGHISNKTLYSSYEKLLNDKNYDQTLEFLQKELIIQAEIYKYFSSNQSDLIDNKIHNVIQLLKSTKTSQWYSVGMAILFPVFQKVSLSSNCKKHIIVFLESLHELMFSLNFIDKVANEIEKALPAIAKTIKYSDENSFILSIQDALTDLEVLKKDQGLKFEFIKNLTLDSEWVNELEKNNSLGNMLIFYLKYKKLGASDLKLHLSSLEHTFPQTPKSTDDWPIIDGLLLDDYKKYIYNIGNFFLTHSSENSSYGNKSFTEKKKSYSDDNIYDVIDETNQNHYKKVSNWDFDVIKNRQALIYTMFQTYTLTSSEFD